ncbi:unnamed protein product [Pseudo-nitzschia multistriata]|uniref:H(+)-exporting diphosphatase n=1 Tax=Pseudo-nitzschia multistriata TaxID=183589 RepID=A0A448ZML7_9STRA|nr:unnamed protein product [Pseudo-nitzschia multistriata]
MKIASRNSALAAALCLAASALGGALAFAPHHAARRAPTVQSSSSSTSLSVKIPRVELPEAVASQLGEFDLKNPNAMNDDDYRSYSGAAIAGTLAFSLLPGALVSGIYSDLGPVAIATLIDFLFSAIVGGGLAIYLSLRKDQIGETVRSYGNQLLSAAKDATGIGTLRYDLPVAATDVLTGELGLLDPNKMDEDDYDGYSGAAVAGTLLFFLLPGALATGAAGILGDFASSAAVDFVLSALVGGGACIYLSLRRDEVGATVSQLGGQFLDVVDGVLGAEEDTKLLEE